METNFKVDVPSFALGYSAGKKKGGSGGGAELNIHYSLDTPPEDTTKLWVKTDREAKRVFVDSQIDFPEGGRAEGIEVLSNKIGTYFRYSSHVAVGNKIYYFGGTTGTTSTAINTIRVFDTETNQYTTLDEVIPSNLAEAACACVGDKIYLFGGRNATNTFKDYTMLDSVYMFDLGTEKIVQLACTLGNLMSNMRAITIGSEIYIFGGCYWSPGGSNPREYSYTRIMRFDVDSQTLQTLGGRLSANDSKYGVAASAVGSKIFMVVDQKKDIYCYDVEKDEVVATGAKLPVNTGTGCESASFGGKAYFVDAGAIHIYNPESGMVETSETVLSYGTNGPAVDTVGNSVYVVSGNNNRNVEIYLPQIGLMTLPNGALKIIPKSKANIFPILNSFAHCIEIGVEKVFQGNASNGGERQKASLYQNGAWVDI